MSSKSATFPQCNASTYVTAIVVLASINILVTFIAVTFGCLYYKHRPIKIVSDDSIDSNEDAVAASAVVEDSSSTSSTKV